MKKLSTCLIGSLITLTLVSSFVFAADTSIISPRSIEEVGYREGQRTLSKQQTWTHTAYNSLNVTDSVTKTCTRTKSTNISFGSEIGFNGLVAQGGVSLEVENGISKEESESRTFNIPPKSTVKLFYGNQLVAVTGYEDTYLNFKLIRSKAVSGKWTYGSYSGNQKI